MIKTKAIKKKKKSGLDDETADAIIAKAEILLAGL